jgi:hypothetical protein
VPDLPALGRGHPARAPGPGQDPGAPPPGLAGRRPPGGPESGRVGPISLVDDAGRMASELVASALRHTDAPVELTVDAGDDVVRIEVRDDDSTAPGTGKVVSFELRPA